MNLNAQKKVLVIDDERPAAELIADFCQAQGLETKVMNSGEDVLNAVKSYRPDLITLDLIMPGFSGFNVLEILKDNEETKDIPVIIISVIADSPSAYEILQLSQAILPKPFKMETLREKIASILFKKDGPAAFLN